ncbi:hypothetical protein J7T55_009871 [Diaporthe amygdali]|uniref:uncharacterized protein n=1 Tax=Phomopsis amygdali TaxID=1214568 RepID=UPI0022FEAEC9|nr:uncharacterized protein J7T55_009871 [Diaporthe amygdali]KAJ0116721.1 hypothetical protein J7T55_009871 [Diaporthe amygdali]
MTIPSAKPTRTATHGRVGASNGRNGFQPSANLVLIKNYFRLESTKAACALLNKEEIKGYRAEFAFEASLNKYLNLQKKKIFSNTICFTSAASDIDALALPASTYTRDIWGNNGTRILQMIDRAVSNAQGGASTSEKSIASLQKYNTDTKNGTTTREFAETIYTGKPVIKSEGGYRFKISFEPPRIEKLKNQDFVVKPGQCWKTMTGLSIVASGYSIPSRPKEGSGLEAPLFVLRQLIKRGCSRQPFLFPDEPMVMFPPTAVHKVGKNDKANQVEKIVVGYKVRLIMASGSEQQGNIVYWHFDPAKICKSNNPFQQMQNQSHLASSAINSKSRHFVGWSENAGLLAAAPKTISSGVPSALQPRQHYELVIPAVTATLRLLSAVTAGVTLTTEKVISSADTEKMYKHPKEILHSVSEQYFVLWDIDGRRGWLVSGDIVALYMLRVHLQSMPEVDLDFSSLNHVGGGSSSAYDVLQDETNLEKVVWPPSKILKEKLNTPEHGEPAKDKEKVKKLVLGEVLDGIYDILLELSALTRSLNPKSGISGQIQDWYEKRWGTTMRGWDFNLVARGKSAKVFVDKVDKDPGWMRMTRALDATFLFTSGLGEIMEPHVGSCCPYFQTLPTGQNFLATSMKLLEGLVRDFGRQDPVNESVARLHWGEVQGLSRAPLGEPNQTKKRLKKDKIMVDGKKMWKKEDIFKWAKDFRNGVVVFGRQPNMMELRQLAQPIQQGNSPPGLRRKVDAVPTIAQSIPVCKRQWRPRRKVQLVHYSCVTVRKSRAATIDHVTFASTKHKQPQKSAAHTSTASARRANSNVSLRSTNSIPRPKDASTGSSRPEASNTQSIAPTAERKPSTSSVRTQTQGSVSSKATGGSRSQTQARQPAAAGLNRTTTNSSDKTTSSHSTSRTQRSATETAAANKRQQQQQQQQQQSQVGTATAAGLAPDRPVSSNHATVSTGTTENPRPTSSDMPSS